MDANGDGGTIYEYTLGERGSRVRAAQQSGQLTTWRRLHVERDSIAGPGQGYAWPADDVANPNPGNPDIGLMVENYKAAYLQVVDDLSQFDTRDESAWVHNNLGPLDNTWTPAQEAQAASPGNSIRDVQSKDDFWVVQVVGAYEGPTEQDYDNEESSTLGYSPLENADGPLLIYLETIRDLAENSEAPNKVPEATLIRRVVLHESLHHFNLLHDMDPAGGGIGDEGPLYKFTNLSGSDLLNQLTQAQLDVVRRASKPD